MSKLLTTFFLLFLTLSFANDEFEVKKDICEEKYDMCISKCSEDLSPKCDEQCEVLYDKCYDEKFKGQE